MHIVVNGWFWGQLNTGSGQYLRWLLQHLVNLATMDEAERFLGSEDAGGHNAAELRSDRKATHRYTLLLPRTPAAHEQNSSQFTIHGPLTTVAAPLPRLPRQLAKLYWEQRTAPLYARRLGADLLLVPYWAAPLWQPAPTVVTVHDLIPLILPAYRGGWLGRLYTGLVSLTARRSAAVLTVSEAGKRDIAAHLKLPAERVYAVHHGPNDATLRSAYRVLHTDRSGAAVTAAECPRVENGGRPEQSSAPGGDAPGALRKKYSLPDRYFLYLGGFDVRKNVTGIVRAYRRYLELGGDPEVQLVVAGTLPRSDTPFFPDPQRLVRQLDLSDQVRFIGWVEEADKARIYAGATAFLFPSAYEGFGMMLLEAMAAGAPVITSSE